MRQELVIFSQSLALIVLLEKHSVIRQSTGLCKRCTCLTLSCLWLWSPKRQINSRYSWKLLIDSLVKIQLSLSNKTWRVKKSLSQEWVNFTYSFTAKEWNVNMTLIFRLETQQLTTEKQLAKRQHLISSTRSNLVVLVNMLELWVILSLLMRTRLVQMQISLANSLIKLKVRTFLMNISQLLKRLSMNAQRRDLKLVTQW